MIIDLPPYIEQAITAKAEQQGITIVKLLEQTFVDDIWQELDKHGLNADDLTLNDDETRHLMALLDNPPPPNEKARALLFGGNHV